MPIQCRNLKSAYENPELVQEYLDNEIRLGRIKGPYIEKPFPIFRCNPIGLVPKKTPGKFRMITNLSAPVGASLNDFIDKAQFPLSYVTVDKAIDSIIRLGQGSLLSKVDIAEAFRIIPVASSQWHLLGIHWNGKYYVDTRLTMGGRSSPYIFDSLSTAIEWLLETNYSLEDIFHLLDDFLTVEDRQSGGPALAIMLKVFQKLGIPICEGKVEGPSTCLEFLGITLDTIRMEARLSVDKVSALKDKLSVLMMKKKVTKRELLSIIGSLSFACRVVVPGRSFLSRLISLSCTARELDFKVYTNKHIKEDIRLWQSFLSAWNGRNFFLARETTSSADLEFSTDAASGSGYGGYFAGSWFSGSWEDKQRDWSMPCQELFPIWVSIVVWADRLSGKRIMVHCDNASTVDFLNKGYTNKEPAATILRKIMLASMRGNFCLKAKHIPGKLNILADHLSRFKIQSFKECCSSADPLPTPIPEHLLHFGS